MNKILVLLLILICSVTHSNGQAPNNTIYIIDSVPVTEHLKEIDIDINPDFIEKVIVIKNKDSLRAIGYRNMGKAILIFTKAYRNRPENLKSIPTTRQMILRDGCWYLKGSNTAYSGEYINYYFNGLKQSEGTFKDGKLTGLRRGYYINGNVEHEGYFNKGTASGIATDYYEDGSLKEQGNFKNNKEAGVWKSYYPNGQVQLLCKYKKGKLRGAAVKYYSNGKVKERVVVKRRKVIADPHLSKIQKIYDSGLAAEREGDYATAIKVYTKCLQMDSTYADAYFERGTAKLKDFKFDDAIGDFDKAIDIEPYYTEAIANRAFCRIKKYQVGNSKTLSPDNRSSVFVMNNDTLVTGEEKQKVCDDLHKAIFLGDKSKLVRNAIIECYPNKAAKSIVIK